jgi:bifunctional DNA-binding transcriptional regulator/antitoxin component of YhaV-PrlF toxin-antitoxin module
MAQSPVDRVVTDIRDGKVAIPPEMQRELGIEDAALLELLLTEDAIVIRRYRPESPASGRSYTDEEIAAFLKEDQLPADENWVRQMLDAKLR